MSFRLFVVLGLLVFLWMSFWLFAPGVHASEGDRKPGTWPKPAEMCTTSIRGTFKWVRDVQKQVWIKWVCRCSIGRITVCRWQMLIVTKRLYLKVQRPDGSWYVPAGWHKHRHFVFFPMASGGYCGHFWPTWHYVPLRLR